MKPSKLLPAGFLEIVLASTGALVATAQTTADDTAQTRTQEAAQPAHFRGSGRDHRGGARFAGRGGHHRGHHGGHGGGEMLRTLFDAVDADGDGTVTQFDIDAYRAARLTEVDASGDGALSIEEFDTLYRAITRSRMVDSF